MLQLAGDLVLLDEPADQVGLLATLLEHDLDGQVADEVAVAPFKMTPMPPRATSPSSWSRARRSDGSGISRTRGDPGARPVNGSVSQQVHPRDDARRVSASLARAPDADVAANDEGDARSAVVSARRASPAPPPPGRRWSGRHAVRQSGHNPPGRSAARFRRSLGSDPDPLSLNPPG